MILSRIRFVCQMNGPIILSGAAFVCAPLVSLAVAALCHIPRGRARPLVEERDGHEADMATQEETSAAEARLPRSHEHSGRSPNHQAPSRQRPHAACCLTLALQREARDRGVGKPLTLGRTSDLERLFRHGERFRGRELLLIRLFRDEGGLRVAFLTARGVGKAVRRNRLRRQLREACRSIWPRIADRPADVLFMALPPAAEAGYGSLRNAMAKLLQRAGVLGASDVAE